MTARDLTGAESRVIAVILANPGGIARSKIMVQANVTKSFFNVMATRLMAEGKISRTGSGPSTVWGPVGIAEKFPKEKRPESYYRDQRRRAERRRSDARNALDAEAWAAAPVRKIVSREWEPPAKLGPASVWELA